MTKEFRKKFLCKLRKCIFTAPPKNTFFALLLQWTNKITILNDLLHWNCMTQTTYWARFGVAPIFNRHGVACSTFLACSTITSVINYLTHWVRDTLVQISSKHCQSQTGKARELTFWENVHPKQCVMCHVSCVRWCRSQATSRRSEAIFWRLSG